MPARWSFFACILVYTALSALLGRDVLAHLADSVAHDAGDPLLNAAILHWSATHIPLTEAWWQLPIFYPTRDAMAFSEHLLGVSVIATPMYWVTGSSLVAYNLTVVLSFALSAGAMFALVWRLTGNVAGAFIAGLAFGFAPFRMSQLPHVQMLATFYAPLSLLGLHAFVDTRRLRWLVLYATAWALQGAANGYTLFFFSVFVGLWVLWFVVGRRDWRGLGAIAAASGVAALALAPTLATYVAVHARHGFVRSVEEIKVYSADLTALLCAPDLLLVWGWVRFECRPEGELFPGVALVALVVAATVGVLRTPTVVHPLVARWAKRATILLLAAATVYGIIAASVWLLGPWTFNIGALRASSSSLRKPLTVALCSVALALAVPLATRLVARRASTTSFYVLAAVAMWVLALGPRVRFMDESIGYDGPFAWLMLLPGFTGLRVPARFWVMAVMCLAIVAGLYVAQVFARRGRAAAVAFVCLAAAVLADGWGRTIPAIPVSRTVPGSATLRGRMVLELPTDPFRDMAAEYRAINGGWRSVNGFSGWAPKYYLPFRSAIEHQRDAAFAPFRALEDLHVLVRGDDPQLLHYVQRQPDARQIGRDGEITHVILPQRTMPPAVRAGTPLPIARVDSVCGTPALSRAADGDPISQWLCTPRRSPLAVTLELRDRHVVGGVEYVVGEDASEIPSELLIETSLDGNDWSQAWNGSPLDPALRAGLENPRRIRMALPFPPREARYVRLTHPATTEPYVWSVAELAPW